MVKSCSAYNCTNRKTTESDLHFFTFPKNPIQLKAWMISMRRVGSDNKIWKPGKHSFICSAHFKPDDMYSVRPGGRIFLRKGTVPTVFNFSTHLNKAKKDHKPPAPKIPSPTVVLLAPRPSPRISTSDHSYAVSHSELDHIKKDCAVMKETVTELQMELKRTKRKLNAKISEVENLKDILLDLKERKLLNCEDRFLITELPDAMAEENW